MLNSVFGWVWFLTKMASSIKLVLLPPGAAVPAFVSASGNTCGTVRRELEQTAHLPCTVIQGKRN